MINMNLKILDINQIRAIIYGEILNQVKMIRLSNHYEKMIKRKKLVLDCDLNHELKWNESSMNLIDLQFQIKM